MATEPTRAEIEALPGPVVVEFGAGWCGYCRGAQPLIAAALERYPQLHHVRIEDGKGRRLGLLFGIKLWPTLVLLSDGREVARVVRPESVGEIAQALAMIAG